MQVSDVDRRTRKNSPPTLHSPSSSRFISSSIWSVVTSSSSPLSSKASSLLDDRRQLNQDDRCCVSALRAASLSQHAGTLSGGNQQKVVVAKWLATQPKVIILDEPTKGIDIGSKAAVHEFMGDLASQGLSVIMVSSELPEILGMSDRVVVMREGLIVDIYTNDDALTSERLVMAAAGINDGALS